MILEGPIATTVTIVNNNSQSQKNAKKLYYMLLKYNWPCSIIEDQLSCCLTFWGHDERAAWRAPQKARYIHFLPVSILFNHHVSLTKNKSTSKPHIHYLQKTKKKFHESRKNRTLKSNLMFVACHDLFFSLPSSTPALLLAPIGLKNSVRC